MTLHSAPTIPAGWLMKYDEISQGTSARQHATGQGIMSQMSGILTSALRWNSARGTRNDQQK